MMRRLLQLNSTQINRFDSSIGSSCQLGVPANVAPNTRRTQFINHANYKIIYINVIDWANATKIHTPPSAKHYFPP